MKKKIKLKIYTEIETELGKYETKKDGPWRGGGGVVDV